MFKLMSAVCLSLILSVSCFAETTSGVIRFQGYIYEDACDFSINANKEKLNSKCFNSKKTTKDRNDYQSFSFNSLNNQEKRNEKYVLTSKKQDEMTVQFVVSYN